MRLLLTAGVVAYLLFTFPVAGSVLWLTLWAYTAGGESLADTVSAAVLNTTAATLVWLAFFGGLDMFFTIWQMMQNREDAARRDKEREEERKERAARDKAWEEERQARTEQHRVREQAQEEERHARAEERRAREQAQAEERRVREQTLEEQRQFHQAVLAQLSADREESRRQREDDRREREQFFVSLLQSERERAQAEKERSDVLMTRILDLAERLENRGNGAHHNER